MKTVIVSPEKKDGPNRLEIAQTITPRITTVTSLKSGGQRSTIIGWQARCYHCHSDPTFHLDDHNGAIDWAANHTCYFRVSRPKRNPVHHSNLHSGITGHSAR